MPIGQTGTSYFEHLSKNSFVVMATALLVATDAGAQTTAAKASQPLATLVRNYFEPEPQNKNELLSKFRRHANNPAYAKGWGLYTESLGKEPGLYTYQYMLALGDEMHRAVRLVVDAGCTPKAGPANRPFNTRWREERTQMQVA